MLKKIIIALFLVSPSISSAASFDCSKASSWIEREVCTNSNLSKLDEALADTYKKILSETSNPNDIKTSQIRWLKESRNKCSDSICLGVSYEARITELNSAILASDPPSKIKKYQRYLGSKPDVHNAIIDITELSEDRVKVEGSALWVGNVETGNVNTGEISGEYIMKNGEIQYFDDFDETNDEIDGCDLVIRIANDQLIVSGDNGKCGGLNVTFDGEYRLIK